MPDYNLKRFILGASLGFAKTGSQIFAALTGTVGVTNGSTALTGSGTNFDPQLASGSNLRIVNDSAGFPQGVLMTLSGAPASDTAATLSSAWAYDTASGLTGYYPTGTTSARTVKPTSAVPAHWLTLGDCVDAEYTRNATFEEVVAAKGGPYEQTDELYKGSRPKLMVTLNEVSEATLESIFATAAITNGTPATPFASDGQLKGWWQLIKKTTAGETVLLGEFFGHGHFTGMKAANEHAKPKLEIAIFKVTGNALTSTLASAA